MFYKLLAIKKENISGKLKWVEDDIEGNREDCGEYEMAGNYYLYRTSDTSEWKRKIIQNYKEEITNTYQRNLKLLQDLEIN